MSARRTPVLLVHHRPQPGGAPGSLALLVEHLDRRFEPHILCPAGPVAERLAATGAEIHAGGLVPSLTHSWDRTFTGVRTAILGRELAAWPGHARELRALVGGGRFPLVHLNDAFLLPTAAIAARAGSRVVAHARTSFAADGTDMGSKLLCRGLERWVDAVIAIDRDVARTVRARVPLAVVPNAVAVHETARPGPPATGGSGLVRVGLVGPLRREKGWPELVRAIGLLTSEGLLVDALVLGGGVRPPAWHRTLRGRLLGLAGLTCDDESQLHAAIAAAGLDARFTCFPFQADTSAFYDLVDIVVFPNTGAGLGRPVLEAAMHGKPVVASGSRDGGGVLLPGETGLLVEPGSAEALAGGIRALAVDPSLRSRLGTGAAEHARRTFDPDRVARAVETVWDTVLGRTPSA